MPTLLLVSVSAPAPAVAVAVLSVILHAVEKGSGTVATTPTVQVAPPAPSLRCCGVSKVKLLWRYGDGMNHPHMAHYYMAHCNMLWVVLCGVPAKEDTRTLHPDLSIFCIHHLPTAHFQRSEGSGLAFS